MEGVKALIRQQTLHFILKYTLIRCSNDVMVKFNS